MIISYNDYNIIYILQIVWIFRNEFKNVRRYYVTTAQRIRQVAVAQEEVALGPAAGALHVRRALEVAPIQPCQHRTLLLEPTTPSDV